MSTKEQDVVLAKNRLAEFKSSYVDAITQYVLKTQGGWDSGVATSSLLNIQRKGAEYFNFCEEFVGNSSLLGAHGDGLWAQGFAEDCYAILQTMPQHFSLLQAGFERLKIEGSFRLWFHRNKIWRLATSRWRTCCGCGGFLDEPCRKNNGRKNQ